MTARAADHGDRAHRLSYDGSFDDVLVSKTRAEGCLVFRRKVKRPLDLSVWERMLFGARGVATRERDGRPGRTPPGEDEIAGMGGGGTEAGTGTNTTPPPAKGISRNILGWVTIRGGAVILMDRRSIARDEREKRPIVPIAMIIENGNPGDGRLLQVTKPSAV